jgi:hypothetical protein
MRQSTTLTKKKLKLLTMISKGKCEVVNQQEKKVYLRHVDK